MILLSVCHKKSRAIYHSHGFLLCDKAIYSIIFVYLRRAKPNKAKANKEIVIGSGMGVVP